VRAVCGKGLAMGWGDELVAAGQAQKLFQQTGQRVRIIDLQGRPRWHDLWSGNPAIVSPAEVQLGPDVQELVNGPNARPYIVYPFTKDTGWTFNKAFRCRDYPATVYLTGQERARGERALQEFGPYVLIEPFTKHDNFRWSLERWAELVAACPDLTFVQHTHAESTVIPGARPVPATFREAIGLIAEASAYVRSESGLCHAAGALQRPQVTIFGGCMDAEVMGGYPNQICLVDEGPQTPCGSWRPCRHCAEAMDRITVEMVRAALLRALQRDTNGTDHVRGSSQPPPAERSRGRRVARGTGSRRPAPEDGTGVGAGRGASEAAGGMGSR
jgi:hypothetical protein